MQLGFNKASAAYGDLYRSVPGTGLWWSIYENDYRQIETTVRPTVNLTVDATDWLKFNIGGNLNYYYIDSEAKNPGSGYANEGGGYSIGHQNVKQENFYASMNIQKQINEVEKMVSLEDKKLSENLDYNSIGGLRLEARQKLSMIKPMTVGQASRISGVSPADINVLLVYLEKEMRSK